MSKATPIPERSRRLVGQRDRWRCQRCGIPAPAGHWHHRRLRTVRDEHTHCTCNGIWLCGICHEWVHHNVAAAYEAGLLMSRHIDEPFSIQYKTPIGWRLPDCEGGWRAS